MSIRPALLLLSAGWLLLACAPSGPTPGITATTSTVTSSVTTTGSATPAATAPASSSSPATTAPQPSTWVLTTDGLGPLKLGMSWETLRQQGYIVDTNGDGCLPYASSQTLQDQGVWLYPSGSDAQAVLAEVGLTSPSYATKSGVRVGHTYKFLKQTYGSSLTVVTKNGNGGPFKVATVRAGDREVVFMFAWEWTMADTDKIEGIVARSYSTDMFGDC